ncbi:MAG: DUF1156 domain-containing protein [Anaerolineae bacterium]
MARPRLLIEEWLPVPAIGVECMRERSTGQQPPDKRLHVWWARRPLRVARAAVLGSLLPAGFDRGSFERLMGFGRRAAELVLLRRRMDRGEKVEGGFGCKRAFANVLPDTDVALAQVAIERLWGQAPVLIDPMAGGGSIPLEAARLGVNTLANEYNPVACSVLEATVDYPFRFGRVLAERARYWAGVWEQRVAKRLATYYPREPLALVHAYIFARTVPCPNTGLPTPLVPDWSLLKAAGSPHTVAEPVTTDEEKGTWTIRVREVGRGAGQLKQPPAPTYVGGKGISLFGRAPISEDYIKAVAQRGEMGSVLYAVATKATRRLEFRPPEAQDLKALADAEAELARVRPQWEREGVIPCEHYPEVTSDSRPRTYGMPRWADMFSPRQLLAMGTLVEELRRLRSEIVAGEGEEVGEAVVHLLALCLDKFANYNCIASKWECTRGVVKGKFDRHDFAFRPTYAELAPCAAGAGLHWAVENVIEAYEKLCELARADGAKAVSLSQGSATSLVHLDDDSITAVVADPPYAGNVQYSELADFFYVWLKRTQGHRRPEWFATPLCEHGEEAVVNAARHRSHGQRPGDARREAHAFYQELMGRVFREAHRILREDGVLTVMFTHKQQSAWVALFESLIGAGFVITATWPVQTESQHSLHQARKNAAQSTVILVARKREPGLGSGWYDETMKAAIRQAAQTAAERLREQGANAVDQMVGAFGPAMEVFSRWERVVTDTGEPVGVETAIQAAADAVVAWREAQLAARGLAGVDAESRLVLLCWDVLGAAEFRFKEAMLLGRSAGLDVDRLVAAGLVERQGEKVRLLPARARRRDHAVREVAPQLQLMERRAHYGRARGRRQIHPGDASFCSAIDMCHALALRYSEGGGGEAGIAAAKSLARQQGWDGESTCARLMEALVRAAPEAVRFAGKGKKWTMADEFPEFRAWQAMLKPVFGIEPPVWAITPDPQPALWQESDGDDEDVEEDVDEEEEE